MEFRLLGSLEAVESGHRLSLGGPKQRTVLAHLLLRPNQVVSADRLIDELWSDDQPPAARNVLQSYVSHLRRSIGKDRLRARAGGYLILVEPHEIDAVRFQDLVDRARKAITDDPASAAEGYKEAIALWRGPALDDLADQPSLEVEIARLEELRIVVAEELIEAQLGLGQHAELVPEIEALVARHPLRERLWAYLMLALYRSGRQADALAAFQEARRVLADELGVDPGTELQALQERVLSQDATLEIAADRLRGYRVHERIGHGAFGEVFRAAQPHIGREVAIKVIHRHLANDPDFIRRFETEAQLVARLEHPHIVPLYDYWREPSGAYLVMRFLRGGTLREALKHGPIAAQNVATVTDQIAQALASAHRQGVVHRDVKPANILFDNDGNAYLSDFGIAKDVARPKDSTRVGSPSFAYYVSPEEVQGRTPTTRADIYSLGLVIFEMLTGRHPYAEARPETLPDKHVREPLPPLSPATGLPTTIDEVIARATAKNPEERYSDAPALAAALRSALGDGAAPAPVESIEARNPYKGIEPFLEADAGDFFGREAMVERLLARLRASRFLVVAGPSGSGKSSLVRAGLVPQLRNGAIPWSDRWFVADMVPGERPFAELERSLLRVASEEPPGSLADSLQTGATGFADVVDRMLPDDDSELLLLIDQFEELFTLVEDEDVRTRFIAELVAAVTQPRSRVRVIVTIRADFYDRPLLYAGLATLVRDATEMVVPLDPEELEQAVARPAARVGVTVAPALMAHLAAEVAGRPGSLPLLQFALTEMFDRRSDSQISLDAYQDIGGVSGAVARTAEETFESLDEPAREAARQLFLRLVTFADSTEDTRRRALRVHLTSLHDDPAPMEAALDAFGRARLLSFDRDPDTRAPTVEVAHEALLGAWQRLRTWIDATREDLWVQRRLALATREWRAAGRDPSFLASGSRLARFEVLNQGSDVALAGDEREFVEASIDELERRRSEDEARIERERQLERRSLRRLRGLVAVLTAAALVSGALTYVAVRERGRAEREARIAAARELAAASVANLDEQPERSILLALEAVDLTRSVDGAVLPEAEEALHRAVVNSRVVRRFPGLGGGLDWSSRDNLFGTEGPEESGLVEIFDATSGEKVLSFRGHDADVNLVAFSDDGSMLATTGDDGTVRVWDSRSGNEIRTFRGPDPNAEAWGPSFSPDGKLVAATWPGEGVVRVWELASGREVHELGPWAVNFITAFSPDGRRLAISTWDSGGVVVDARSGDELFSVGAGEVRDVDWSPDGRWIATSETDSTTRLWDARTGKPRFTLYGHRGQVVASDWSPDSTRLVSGSNDGNAKVWEIAEDGTRELLSIPAQDGGGGIWPAFSSDGDRVMTGDQQVTAVKIWDVSRTGNAEWANVPADDDLAGVAFLPHGDRLIASNGAGSITMWHAQTGDKLGTVPRLVPSNSAAQDVMSTVVASPDGELVAASGPVATVWEVESRQEAFTVRTGAEVQDIAWSPDGRFLAVVDVDGHARIVDRTGATVAALPDATEARLSAVAFSPDGRLLATAKIPYVPVPGAGAVTIWDWKDERPVKTIPTVAEGVAFDRTGNRIATANLPGAATIWDVNKETRLATLSGHTGAVIDVAFAPDDSTVVTGGSDGTVRIWDPDSGDQKLILRGHEEVVWDVAFSPDGSKLASSSPEGTVRIWALDLDDLIDIAKSELTRELTDQECRQYLHLDACT